MDTFHSVLVCFSMSMYDINCMYVWKLMSAHVYRFHFISVNCSPVPSADSSESNRWSKEANNTITFGKKQCDYGDEDVGERRVNAAQPVNISLHVLVFVQLSG